MGAAPASSAALSGVQGLPRASVERQAEELLESVKLTAAATTRTAAYSGGMRRRLR
jgi:ABC-type multidrug transport system ATPase subunit